MAARLSLGFHYTHTLRYVYNRIYYGSKKYFTVGKKEDNMCRYAREFYVCSFVRYVVFTDFIIITTTFFPVGLEF